MKYIFTLIINLSVLYSNEIIHSSISSYLEQKSFSNSIQKESGAVYGLGSDIHFKTWSLKTTYEYADTKTKQPPLKSNLYVEKLFLRTLYKIDNSFTLNLNYINVLNDNIAITSHGKAYGFGLDYKFNKKLNSNFTYFYTKYDAFDVYQNDFKVDYKLKIDKFKIKLSSITKYINIDEREKNGFTKFAKSSYLTTGFQSHILYDIYHAGFGVSTGSRAFAVMNEGFKIQHHAMEFDKSYAFMFGVNLGKFVLRAQYIQQRAIELPTPKQEYIDVDNIRLLLNYRL